jgi:hypothetical protein
MHGRNIRSVTVMSSVMASQQATVDITSNFKSVDIVVHLCLKRA